MPTKKRKGSSSSRGKGVTAAVRAEDERLREELRHADLRKFDTALAKALSRLSRRAS